MPRPILQVEFEPLTIDDLDLLAKCTRLRPLNYLEARSIVRIGRLQRYLNEWYSVDKIDADGRLGPVTLRRRAKVEQEIGPIRLDPETSWFVDAHIKSHPNIDLKAP